MDSTEKTYKECELPPATLKKVLLKEYKGNDASTFESILLKANPEPLALMNVVGDTHTHTHTHTTTQSIEQSLGIALSSEVTLDFKNIFLPDAKDPDMKAQDVEIETEMDNILTEIKINNSKIPYLKAQLFMLEQFHEAAMATLPEEIRVELLKEYGIFTIFPGVRTPIVSLLEDLPCKIRELKFLVEIVKKYEQRKK